MSLHRLLVLALLAVAAACDRSPTPPQESKEPLKQYPMRGAVLRLDPQGHIATIKNEKIEGWMEAMTMDFPVKDPADFDKLHPGDAIQATVFVQGLNYWVGEVRPAQAASPAAPAAK